MANVGKTQLIYVMLCPDEHAEEGKRLFASHGPWMEATHHREGPKALISYNVSYGPELSDLVDPDSEPTGRTVFVLSEIYESPEGVEDHFAQANESWADYPAFMAWLDNCEVVGLPAVPIVNSLW